MKKTWEKPQLEILDVKMTMNGPGVRDVDEVYSDQDEVVELHES